ncbi:MAG TPA: SDR family NAD(P)-dependent oxidoreductase, partial [Gemmatimonadaceae bacterium]|nr:SDR family NAD(P)-dependent oxidoreductase [Gemmatimonadaceae bacterium]
MSASFRPDLLAGKAAFVAGGTSGINLAIAHALAAHGAGVAVMSRNAERVAGAVEALRAHGGEVFGMAGDVRDFGAVTGVVDAAREAIG